MDPLTTTVSPDAVVSDVVLSAQLNHHGTFFGGAALALMTRAAFVAASRAVRGVFHMVALDDDVDRNVTAQPVWEGPTHEELLG